MRDAERYAITVRRVVVDDEELWRATVRELPDLAEFAETREEALDLALDAIESLKTSAAESGEPFPEPVEDEDEYSGRVTLRMPKSLHRTIALKAMDEDVSLNWYIVTQLSLGLSQRGAQPVTLGSAAISNSTQPYVGYFAEPLVDTLWSKTVWMDTDQKPGAYTQSVLGGLEATITRALTGAGVNPAYGALLPTNALTTNPQPASHQRSNVRRRA